MSTKVKKHGWIIGKKKLFCYVSKTMSYTSRVVNARVFDTRAEARSQRIVGERVLKVLLVNGRPRLP